MYSSFVAAAGVDVPEVGPDYAEPLAGPLDGIQQITELLQKADKHIEWQCGEIRRLTDELAAAKEACRKAVDCAERMAMNEKTGWHEAWIAMNDAEPNIYGSYLCDTRYGAECACRTTVPGDKPRRVLVKFADQPGQPGSVEQIPDGVWWDEDSEQGCFQGGVCGIGPNAPDGFNYYQFFEKWCPRALEFPQSREEAEARAKAKELNHLESFLCDTSGDTKEHVQAELQSQGVDVGKLNERVGKIVATAAQRQVIETGHPLSGAVYADDEQPEACDKCGALADDYGKIEHVDQCVFDAEKPPAEAVEILLSDSALVRVMRERNEAKRRVAELETQLADRTPQSADFERRVEAFIDEYNKAGRGDSPVIWHMDLWLRDALKKHFSPTTQPNPWREPREVPQSPWVVLKLESDAEVPAIFTGRLFTSDQDVVYSQADITGWRYAVSEPEGERFVGYIRMHGVDGPYDMTFSRNEFAPANLQARCKAILYVQRKDAE